MPTDLARRAVACPSWIWLPGMRVHEPWVDGWFRLHGGKCDGENDRIHRASSFGVRVAKYARLGAAKMLPDLTDPATLGALFHLVREAWGPAAQASPRVNIDDLTIGGWVFYANNAEDTTILTDTEAEALVVALEAAPTR